MLFKMDSFRDFSKCKCIKLGFVNDKCSHSSKPAKLQGVCSWLLDGFVGLKILANRCR